MNYPQLFCTDLLNTEAERLKVTHQVKENRKWISLISPGTTLLDNAGLLLFLYSVFASQIYRMTFSKHHITRKKNHQLRTAFMETLV